MSACPHEETSNRPRVHALAQAVVFVALLLSNVAQRVTFKTLGYSLGPYPYFVLLSISAAFVPIFAVVCAVIIARTGGFLPETRTWRCLGVYVIIGCCNALQGLGMVFANPYVAGYLQTLLQQGTIPFTFLISLVALRSQFAVLQYVGVVLISVGLFAQFAPDISAGNVAQESDFAWALVFLFAQLPVAVAAVLQEQAFSHSPVNPFHMMFWASTAQFVLLLLLSPLSVLGELSASDSIVTCLQKFVIMMNDAWMVLIADAGAICALVGCIFTMLSSQLAQAFMVKVSSAAFAVLCLAFVVPASAAAFSMRAIMGSHSEHLDEGSEFALVFVFAGIALFQWSSKNKGSLEGLDEELLSDHAYHTPPPPPSPPLCASSVGMIHSGFTDAQHTPCSVWEVRTLREQDALKRMCTP